MTWFSLPLLAVAATLFPASVTAVASARFYVRLEGSDAADGSTRATAFQTMGRAQRAVRAAVAAAGAAGSSGPVKVFIGPGAHRLVAPLEFGAADGGASPGSRVTYQRDGSQPAVLSGGLAVTGWQAATMAGWMVANLSSSAPAVAFQSRHLWVGGRRAERTEVPGSTGPRRPPIWGAGAWIQESKSSVHWLNMTDSNGQRRVTCSSSGFELKAGAEAEVALGWPAAGRGVELVFQGVFPAPWAEPRCSVVNVSRTANNGAKLVMAQPCHCSYTYKCLLMTGGKPSVHPPTAIVNVGVGLANATSSSSSSSSSSSAAAATAAVTTRARACRI